MTTSSNYIAELTSAIDLLKLGASDCEKLRIARPNTETMQHAELLNREAMRLLQLLSGLCDNAAAHRLGEQLRDLQRQLVNTHTSSM